MDVGRTQHEATVNSNAKEMVMNADGVLEAKEKINTTREHWELAHADIGEQILQHNANPTTDQQTPRRAETQTADAATHGRGKEQSIGCDGRKDCRIDNPRLSC